MPISETQGRQAKIALLGRSGIGKTSVITALMDEARQQLKDTPYTVEPADVWTEKMIESNRDLLEGSFFAASFNHRAIKSTADDVHYALMLTTPGTRPFTQLWTTALDEFFDLGHPTILFAFKDYPGVWIDPTSRQDATVDKRWAEYLQWIRESSVLVVPIDSPLLMEGSKPEQKVRVPSLLHLSAVRAAVEEWTKARVASNLPGLLLLTPIRCESYFSDNGGDSDRGAELLAATRQLYGGLLDHIHSVDNTSKLIRVEYHPIDTVGAVRVAEAQWPPDATHAETDVNFKYEVRPPGMYTPYGAVLLLSAITRHLLAYWEAERQAAIGDLEKASFWDIVFNAPTREKAKKLLKDWFLGLPTAFRQTMTRVATLPAGKRVVVLRS